MTETQKRAIEEIHSWDRNALLMELEALIGSMTDEQIKETILKKNE